MDNEKVNKKDAGYTSAASIPANDSSNSIAPPPFQLKLSNLAEKEEDVSALSEKVEESFTLSSRPSDEGESQTTPQNAEAPFQLKRNTALPEEVQAKMQDTMGHDFSNVNIHSNSTEATDVGALAYAQGNDVHFAPGQFSPETKSGQELIGHELAHVAQQREGRVQPTVQAKGVNINDDQSLETEADVLGKRAASSSLGGETTSQLKSDSSSGGVVQRFSFMDDVVGPLGNNMLGAGTGLLNAAMDPISTFGKASQMLNGTPMDHLVNQGMNLRNGVRGMGGMAQGALKGLGGVTSIAGLIGGGKGIYDYFDNDNPNTGMDTAELVFNNTPAMLSGLIGTLELGASGLGALGIGGTAATAGTATAGAGAAAGGGGLLASLGPVGAALGAFAGGWTAGRGIDNLVGWGMDKTGASDALDEMQGVSRPDGQHGDYSLSGMLAGGMQAQDEAFTSVMRSVGAYDEEAPEYTQTIGWKLAEILPSWMQ